MNEIQVPFYAIKSKVVAQTKPLMQLMVPLTLNLNNGSVVKVQALIDTGAQANLINEDLIPQGSLTWARDQLHLVAANGLKIPGGKYEVHTKTHLQKLTQEGTFKGLQEFEASFHVAQLSLDAIFSYPWLARNGLVVGPQRNSLMLPHPEQLVLQPVEEGPWKTVTRHSGKGKRARVEHIKVGTQGMNACVGVSVCSGATQGSSAARCRTNSKRPGLLVSAQGGRFSGTPGSGVSSSANFPHGHGRVTHPNMFSVLQHPRDSSTSVRASFEEDFTTEIPRTRKMPRKKKGAIFESQKGTP